MSNNLVLPSPPARLRAIGVLAAAKAVTRRVLEEKSVLRVYRSGAPIWHDGDANIVVVQSGRCKLQIMSSPGQATTLSFLGPGDIAGLIEQSPDKSILSVYITTSSVSAVHIANEHMVTALETDMDLRNAVSAHIRDEALMLRRRLFQMATLSVFARVAAYLLSEIKTTATSHDIENPLTHEEIASIIGANREAVTRAFRTMAAQGIVTYSRQNIHVSNTQKLQSLIVSG